MLAASYPTLAHERTTIKFIIRGFANHPDFLYVISIWASQLPSTIQDLLSMATSVQSMAKYIASSTPVHLLNSMYPPAQIRTT